MLLLGQRSRGLSTSQAAQVCAARTKAPCTSLTNSLARFHPTQAPISSTALQHEALARAPPPTQRQAQPSSRAPSAAHTASHQLLQQQQQQLLLRQALAQVQAEQRGQRSMPPPSGGAAAQRAAGAAAGPPVSASPRRVSASAQVGSSAGPWRGEAPSAGPAGRPRLEAPAMDPAIGAALMRLLQQQAEMLRA